MKKTAITLLVVVVVNIAIWLGWAYLYFSESGAFRSVAVGDSERALVDTLTRRRIAFHRGHGPEWTVYSHSDGFVGVYFYFVEDGRVVRKAVD